MFKRVRTRFAPSPTGHLHLGGVRTALYNYLFAAHHGGDFIVRFEDTDLIRNRPDVEEKLLAQLSWAGLKISESVIHSGPYAPYRQSERLAIYRKMGIKLLNQARAYRCFCSKEQLHAERTQQLAMGRKAPQYSKKCLNLSSTKIQTLLQAQQPYCLRLNVVAGQKGQFQDLVYGAIDYATEHIEDFVLIKSNGYPTYNFAVVVDDYLMQISHVLRGSDHLSNTPKQILLYQAFKWPQPTFGHLTLIQSSATDKMSKRQGDSAHFLTHYIKHGYLPIGVINYLALLGWCPDLKREVFSLAELSHLFNGQNLNRAQSVFDFGKLNWMNRQHLSMLSSAEFTSQIWSFALAAQKHHGLSASRLTEMINVVRGEINYFAQIDQAINSFFVVNLVYTPEQMNWLERENNILRLLASHFAQLSPWTETAIGEILQKVQTLSKLSKKGFFRLVKVALTAKSKTPRLKTILYLMKQNHIARLFAQLFQKMDKIAKKEKN